MGVSVCRGAILCWSRLEGVGEEADWCRGWLGSSWLMMLLIRGRSTVLGREREGKEAGG